MRSLEDDGLPTFDWASFGVVGKNGEYDRDRHPPLLLLPSSLDYLSRLSLPLPHPPPPESSSDAPCPYLSHLRLSLAAAVSLRQADVGVRPLPYVVVPEHWKRLRPVAGEPRAGEEARGTEDGVKAHALPNEAILAIPLRPLLPRPFPGALDVLSIAVSDLLEKHEGLHVSDGAKFGADLLLYDGPRDKRHAFAGLRVYDVTRANPCEGRLAEDAFVVADPTTFALPSPTLATRSPSPPPLSSLLPSAVDMCGYVRLLNGAGKIAIVAFVDAGRRRVTYVDLVLEKVLDAETHVKWGRKEKRKDMSKNLGKK